MVYWQLGTKILNGTKKLQKVPLGRSGSCPGTPEDLGPQTGTSPKWHFPQMTLPQTAPNTLSNQSNEKSLPRK